MKTINNNTLKKRIGFVILSFAIILIMFPAMAQKNNKIDYLSLKKLPTGLILEEKNPLSYEVITDYYNHDILGNFLNKMQVKGIYTRGLDSGKVKWNDVTISKYAGEDQPFPEGAKQDYMENFTYRATDNLLMADVFKDFPPTTGIFAKNLVWDVLTFEVFAWTYYDSLKLNVPYTAQKINGAIELAGMGTFENKNIQLTWTGNSMMNNRPCAVIEFLAMDNPINFKTDFMEMKGRSHYWGTIWLSLTDKQIEYGILHEDVNMEMKMSGQEKSQLLNTTRKIDFIKLKENL